MNGTGREVQVIIDRDGRYLAANDQALLDLAIEVVGCLHDHDRLRRPHTERLTLTDLDAGVTALYEAVAHLKGEGDPQSEEDVEALPAADAKVRATFAWRGRQLNVPDIVEMLIVLLPLAGVVNRCYAARFTQKALVGMRR